MLSCWQQMLLKITAFSKMRKLQMYNLCTIETTSHNVLIPSWKVPLIHQITGHLSPQSIYRHLGPREDNMFLNLAYILFFLLFCLEEFKLPLNRCCDKLFFLKMNAFTFIYPAFSNLSIKHGVPQKKAGM